MTSVNIVSKIDKHYSNIEVIDKATRILAILDEHVSTCEHCRQLLEAVYKDD